MNGKKLVSTFLLMLVSALVMSMAVFAVPVANLVVEVDDLDLSPISAGVSNPLDLERGETFDVEVIFDATADNNDMEITAFITGYEYNDIDPISDSTGVFKVTQDTTYKKRLDLRLPNDVDPDEEYLLRVIVSDRNSASLVEEYRLRLDAPRNDVRIEDVFVNPDKIVAGRFGIVQARIENSGQRDQDVKVTVEVAELGIIVHDWIDEVDAGDEVTSEALGIKIPTCAEAGVYMVDVIATYDSGRRTDTTSVPITVLESELCPQRKVVDECGVSCEPHGTTTEKTIIGVGPSSLEVQSGSSVLYPVTITNAGTTTKTYMLTVDGVAGWADVQLTPSNVVVINGGETKVVYASVGPTKTGQHTFVVNVKHNDQLLQQLPATVTVTGTDAVVNNGQTSEEAVGWESVKRGLEIGLVVLVVLLVILGLIIAFNKMKNDDDEDRGNEGNEASQTYY